MITAYRIRHIAKMAEQHKFSHSLQSEIKTVARVHRLHLSDPWFKQLVRELHIEMKHIMEGLECSQSK